MAPTADIFDQKLEGVAWRTKPSWYIVGANDQTVNPDLERAAAQRMGATTYEFETSHVPMVSRTDLVLDVVRTAANAVQESLSTV
jgi:pimeloyl-ACP methyl ester carboxylesterase